jgi:hypothetical protein
MSSHVFNLEKWATLSVFEQMGNIGSEVGRSMNALECDDAVALEGAYRRGLDLIDATVNIWHSESRKRELLRARELFTTSVDSREVDRQLDTYFMQYAIATRTSLTDSKIFS